jgi:hypothetical protein
MPVGNLSIWFWPRLSQPGLSQPVCEGFALAAVGTADAAIETTMAAVSARVRLRDVMCLPWS